MACIVGSIVGMEVSSTVGEGVAALEVGFRVGRLEGLTGDLDGFFVGLLVDGSSVGFLDGIFVEELVGCIVEIIGEEGKEHWGGRYGTHW